MEGPLAASADEAHDVGDGDEIDENSNNFELADDDDDDNTKAASKAFAAAPRSPQRQTPVVEANPSKAGANP